MGTVRQSEAVGVFVRASIILASFDQLAIEYERFCFNPPENISPYDLNQIKDDLIEGAKELIGNLDRMLQDEL